MNALVPPARRSVLIGAAAVAAGLAAGAAHADDTLAGTWGGVLQVGALRLRLKLVIDTGPPASATLYSLDQGGAAIEGEVVMLTEQALKASFASVKGALDVARDPDGALVGTWRQGRAAPIRLVRNPDFDALAQEGAPEPLSASRLAALRAAAGSPALAAAARRKDGASLSLVDGLRRVGHAAQATTADRWHLGSITKSMTATAIARLVEAGLLSWELTVGEVLGEVAPDMNPAYRDLRFDHLLSHRGGLAANISGLEFATFPREEADSRASRERYVRLALSQTPVGEAGATFLYSNSGFVIAGALAERLVGAPIEALIQREVFEPLGLTSAGFGAPGVKGADDEPSGHAAGPLERVLARRKAYPLGGGLTDNPAVLGPAGRAHMSLADLLTYAEAHRDAGPYLSAASWARLHTPPFGGDYALGWVVLSDGALWHNGSNTLWYAEVLVDRSAGVVAAAAANDGWTAKSEPAVAAALAGARSAV